MKKGPGAVWVVAFVLSAFLMLVSGLALLGPALGRTFGPSFAYNVGGVEGVWSPRREKGLEVTVVDIAGRPLPRVAVFVTHGDGQSSQLTGADGRVVLLTGGMPNAVFVRLDDGPIVQAAERVPSGMGCLRVRIIDPKASVPHDDRPSGLFLAFAAVGLAGMAVTVVRGLMGGSAGRRSIDQR